MEVEEIVRNVFGRGSIADDDLSSGTKSKGSSDTVIFRTLRSLGRAEEYMRTTLGEIDRVKTLEDNRPGRIGPKLVRFDVATHHGRFIISLDRLSVNSQSKFSSIKANTALYSGKWMYEVQLGFKGVMQIGWATEQCKFTQDSGVGDTPNSYAYDGNRVRKWNVATHKYGESWLSGDIIGCTLDMDEGTIGFYRNGRSLGTAFEGIAIGAGIAYLPSVSLGISENLTANFGASPLNYPVEGYQALQAPPTDELNKAALMFAWLGNLISLINQNRIDNESAKKKVHKISMSTEAFLMSLGRIIIKHLGPLLTVSYITEAIFIPFVRKICASVDEHWKLTICMDLLWMFLEEHELTACLENTAISLLSAFRHVSISLDFPDQRDNLVSLIDLCRHKMTRQHLLQHILFDRVEFAKFLHVSPLDEIGLTKVVSKTWWETNPLDVSVEISKESYMDACNEIKSATSDLECLQIQLLILLLDNDDGTSRTPSSRTIFLRKFRRFVQENLISRPTSLPVTVSCLHRLLQVFRILWTNNAESIFVPCRLFYDSSIDYYGIDRLGGVLSHLNKTFKTDLIKQLGADHEVITSMEQIQEPVNTFMGGPASIDDATVIPTFARFLSMDSSRSGTPMILERIGYSPYSREDRTPLRLGAADSDLSLLELLDGIIMFYHASAKEQIANVAGLRDIMSEYATALSDTKSRLELIKTSKDPEAKSIQKELVRTISVFNNILAEQSRHMAWIRAVVYSEEKQAQIAWLLRIVTYTLKTASQQGNMFSFVPIFYLEAVFDLYVGLRSHLHPTVPIEKLPGYDQMFRNIAQFLCDHFLDPRIVHANAKDKLILMLAGFASNPLTLPALESVPEKSRVKFVKNLLRPYESRAWAQSNWLLVRFWQGHGFAFRYTKSPHLSNKVGPRMPQQASISNPINGPYPSILYQNHVKNVLLNNIQATTLFLNSLLNQLNWAFSEFIEMIQEIHNVSSRPEPVFVESRELKICATCFDLAMSLLRVIEMIATIAPSIFNDSSQPSSENLLVRLCQLLCQILNRVSSQTSSFQHVVLLDIPDLETVDHLPILAAVIGILLALLKDEMAAGLAKESEGAPRTTRTILMEPSFQMSSLYFVLGEGTTTKTNTKNLKTFTFLNYKGDVSEDEILSVRKMIEYLEANRALLPESRLMSDDDDTCTICYAYPVAVTFKPCNHQSCRGCIDRHILNSKECFFCKTIITEIHDLDGKLLHDLSTDAAKQN